MQYNQILNKNLVQLSDSRKIYRLRDMLPHIRVMMIFNKKLSYRRETALQGTLVLSESGRLELRDNTLLIL